MIQIIKWQRVNAGVCYAENLVITRKSVQMLGMGNIEVLYYTSIVLYQSALFI
ncbi:hypothetical protein RhiirA5_345661 [Rhizophagus irregularis]|uniref:Uncharacterized protein n=1 Tax=Rhizophagus irregularis TaxID=588596 RepID=A0A2N0QFF9_9GLOM|nr:hypothetical protein RhiirA5_345661 [Rhizophagus irregularis]